MGACHWPSASVKCSVALSVGKAAQRQTEGGTLVLVYRMSSLACLDRLSGCVRRVWAFVPKLNSTTCVTSVVPSKGS